MGRAHSVGGPVLDKVVDAGLERSRLQSVASVMFNHLDILLGCNMEG